MTSSTTSIQRPTVPAVPSSATSTTSGVSSVGTPLNQESITTNSDVRPIFTHSTSIDRSLGPAAAVAPKRKDEAFADLEQNLQNIMAGVTKPKTTTTPSTPTTSAGQTSFIP